jgi:hypothetical protein
MGLYIIFSGKLGFSPKTRCRITKEDNLKNHLLENLNNFISVMYGEKDLPTSTLNLKAVYTPQPPKLSEVPRRVYGITDRNTKPETSPTRLIENEYQELLWRGKITAYDPEDGGIIFLRNIAVYLQDYTVSQGSETIVIT